MCDHWNESYFELYFHVVLFIIMLYNVVLTFKSVDKTQVCDHSNESYWAVLSCGIVYYMLCKVVLTFKYVDETIVCDHWNESYFELYFRASTLYVYHAIQDETPVGRW